MPVISGAQFPFRSEGKGTCVLLLHGFLENQSMWNGLFARRPEGFQFIAPDLPGHGSNMHFPAVLSMDQLASDLNAFLEERRIKELIVVGHSMGGYVASAFAAGFPSKVKGLVLFHSTATDDDEEKQKNRLRAVEAVRQNQSLYCQTMIRSLFDASNLEQLEVRLHQLIQDAVEMPRDAIVAALLGMKERANRVETLKSMNDRVAYILGDRDPRLPLEHSLAEMTDVQPAFQRVLSHCGHMGQWEQPEEAGTALLEAIRHFE